jgi:hypothetical protein
MSKLVKQGKKAKDAKRAYSKNDLWIAPANTFKRTGLQSDWKLRRPEPSESNRFLELADVALGFSMIESLSTTEKRKRKATA